MLAIYNKYKCPIPLSQHPPNPAHQRPFHRHRKHKTRHNNELMFTNTPSYAILIAQQKTIVFTHTIPMHFVGAAISRPHSPTAIIPIPPPAGSAQPAPAARKELQERPRLCAGPCGQGTDHRAREPPPSQEKRRPRVYNGERPLPRPVRP